MCKLFTAKSPIFCEMRQYLMMLSHRSACKIELDQYVFVAHRVDFFSEGFFFHVFSIST